MFGERLLRLTAVQNKLMETAHLLQKEIKGSAYKGGMEPVQIVFSESSTPPLSKNSIEATVSLIAADMKRKTSLNLEVQPKDLRSSAMTLITEGSYETEIQKVLLGYLGNREKPVFIDVGSNEGFHSLTVGASIRGVLVHSFEPNPTPYMRLIRNIEINGLENQVIPYNFAIGAETSNDSLHIPVVTGSGGASLRNLHPEEGDPEVVEVSVSMLDLLKLRCDLMKLDVEGAEFDAISGAIQTIRLNKPVIVVELLRKWMREFNKHPNDVFELLGSLGYDSYAISEDGCRHIGQVDEDTVETNFVFVHSSEDTRPQEFF